MRSSRSMVTEAEEEAAAAASAGGDSEAGDSEASDSEAGDEFEGDFRGDLVHFHTPPAKRRRRGDQWRTFRAGVPFADED